MVREYDIKEIISQFDFKGKLIDYINHICGHINDTYIVRFDDNGETVRYILQRINSDIFKNPQELMENIKNVTAHIAKKVVENGGNPLRETLNIINTKDGQIMYHNEEVGYWRAFVFIEGASTYQKVEKPEHLYTSGKALGKFQKQLSDFPMDKLFDTIPDFHNTAKRYEAFLEAVKNDAVGRVSSIEKEIKFITDRAEETKLIVNLIESGDIPLRVTHNDTKFNNIMIDDATGEGIAVIDLDTVMPGSALYDFGDSMRSGATTALEDEVDLSKVNFDINLFEQYAKGFLEETKNSLTDKEKEYLAFSAKLITFEQAIRFLGDHINGDTYFKVHRENHNLERAINQLKLVSDMEKQMNEMKAIVNKYAY